MITVKLGSGEITQESCPYIISEIGANHNGDLALAKTMVDKCIDLGCDCAKFQAFTVESCCSTTVYENNPGLKEDVCRYSLDRDDLIELARYCAEKKIDFCCTPENEVELDFLIEKCGMKFIKIASQDVTSIPFLKYIASKKLPMILSTGLAKLAEIENAVEILTENGNDQLVILHCVSLYPPEDAEVNLKNISMLKSLFDFPIGYSDHTLGYSIPLAAAAMGASVIEKHFTMDKDMEGWDHAVSANPEELKIIVEETKRIHTALGSYKRVVSEREKKQIVDFKKSVVLRTPLKKGEIVTIENIDFKRPQTGIKPEYLELVIGRAAAKDIDADRPVNFEDLR
ncbi:N-acetylneuraminate synthase family protein [Maridesulfovibrio sp.]|uniref:N-acetylneuraminate synthase family protein n=1 Tax=Maridesulfovibrio sp. TaxID=2795000 RepID=UPI002A18DFF5|nr:N-acetylneuraminate synthase family protein [Maridesulfovibrio sp.]